MKIKALDEIRRIESSNFKALKDMLDRITARAQRTYDPSKALHAETTDAGAVTVRLQGPMDGGYWGGTSAADIIEAMQGAKSVHMIIDSPGGLVSEGFSLYSELRSLAEDGVTITTEGRGLVASAAVLPFVAGDERDLAEGTMMMIHNPWGMMFLVGDDAIMEDESRKMVAALRALKDNYAVQVSVRTGKPKSDVLGAMRDETWYNLDESEEFGFMAQAQGTGGPSTDDPVATAKKRFADNILSAC